MRGLFALLGCLLVTVAWAQPRETLLVERSGDSDVTVKTEYHSIRVVFSLPVERTPIQPVVGHGIEPTSAVATVTSEDLRGFLTRLDYALSAGRIEDTLDLLNGASEGQRTVAYRRLGELLRSAHVVEQILDRDTLRVASVAMNRYPPAGGTAAPSTGGAGRSAAVPVAPAKHPARPPEPERAVTGRTQHHQS